MAISCTATQVSNSNFAATGSITGLTGQVSCLIQAAYLSPVLLLLACICIYVSSHACLPVYRCVPPPTGDIRVIL
jgi:hypothetical protein